MMRHGTTKDPAAGPRPRVELRIDELVLRGYAPGTRWRVGAAVEAELRRLLAEGGLPPALAGGGRVERLDGGACRAAPGATPEAAGAQIARAIYTRMGR